MPNHVRLVQRIGTERSRACFAELFRHFAPRVRAMLLKRGADATQAEELVQETMLTVWRRAATFDPDRASVAAWVYTIARNKWVDRVRRQARRPEPAEAPSPAASKAPEPESRLHTARSVVALRDALERLPEPQAQVLHASFFEFKTQAQIASELRLPTGTVKSRTRLGLRRLRILMEEGQ